MIALRNELISYINLLPENKLTALKPLLSTLCEDIPIIEKVSFEDLDNEDKKAVIQAREEYKRGECTDLEDLMRELGDI